VRQLMGRAVRALPVRYTNLSFGFKAATFLKGAGQLPPHNHAHWMSSFSPHQQSALLTPAVARELGPHFYAFEPIERAWQRSAGESTLARATHLDAVTYLPNDILMKVDRASMQYALEVRAPFLARDVVEFAFALPDSFRMRGLTGKRLLRDAVRELLPAETLRRPKKGFGIPVATWLNGALRPLLHELLSADALRQTGLFRPDYVQQLVREHAAGQADHRKQLWTLLVFELWRRHHLVTRVVEPLSLGIA
jgi:asparagine synthase (glutamine-hydrolysing)